MMTREGDCFIVIEAIKFELSYYKIVSMLSLHIARVYQLDDNITASLNSAHNIEYGCERVTNFQSKSEDH